MYIEKLSSVHPVKEFDCGVEVLNQFLSRYALKNQKKDSSQTWVACSEGDIVGYYTLVVGGVDYIDSPDILRKGLPRHSVPVMILARLAVSKKYQGKRIGQGMLLDVLRRTINAAELAGIRAILVHAKDEDAATFYKHFGFEPFPENPLTLYLLLKDIRAMILNKN